MRLYHTLSLLFLSILPCQAFAQTTPACPSAVKASDDKGLVRIRIESLCRRNEKVSLRTTSLEKSVFLSETGVGEIVFPATQILNRASIIYRDGSFEEVEANSVSFGNVLRFTIQWDQPVDLNLHIAEPGTLIRGTPSAQTPSKPQSGTKDLADDGKGEGPFLESYVIPDRAAQRRAIYTVYVENSTRSRVPGGEHCGAGEFAKVSVTLTVTDLGTSKQINTELPAAPCDAALDDQSYFTKIRY